MIKIDPPCFQNNKKLAIKIFAKSLRFLSFLIDSLFSSEIRIKEKCKKLKLNSQSSC